MGVEVAERMAAEARGSLVSYAREHVVEAGALTDRARLEQSLCFAGAVWNAVVMMEALEDPHALAELSAAVDGLPPKQREALRRTLWALCERKLRDHRGKHWVYRHLHVVCGEGGELFVRCEALTLTAWLQSGQPLRMGLVE